MTRESFSNGFDVLLDSFSRRDGFGTNNADIRLNEHEKSVFLTEAQEAFVLSLYNGKNPYGDSFESTEEIRRYLSPLIREANLSPIETSNGKPLGIESNSKFFTLPDDLWFITFERVLVAGEECESKANIDVYPVRQDEYHKIRKNPFRGANGKRALRLDLSDNVIEIISKNGCTSYYVRYLKKLKPIILVDLTNDGLSINGVTEATDCELHESLHQRILEMAVEMALRAKGINVNSENR